MTPSGIETETFRFVAQHLKHCATAVRKQCTSHCKNSKTTAFTRQMTTIYKNVGYYRNSETILVSSLCYCNIISNS